MKQKITGFPWDQKTALLKPELPAFSGITH